MSLETAQSEMTADPNAQLANAADAFKAFTSEEPATERKPRDDKGRFAPEQPQPELEDAEPLGEAEPDDADEIDDAEADDESQLEPVELPTSWSKEKAEIWESLPAEAQAYIAERDAEQTRSVNQKFQEAANVKKATEAQLAEANANRDAYKGAIDQVLSMVQPVAPDPRAYGAGTGNYDRESYDLAVVQYQDTMQTVQALQQQQQAIAAQQEAESRRAFEAEIEAIEAVARPRFIADVPELTQPDKAGAVLNDIVRYAVEAGIPENVFAADALNGVTSAELHIAWKAMQFDKIKAAKGQVQATPAPKPAQPSIKPGVASSRSATRQATVRKANERLASEGSIEAGAAVWKNFLT
jgi:hypothetical protein